MEIVRKLSVASAITALILIACGCSESPSEVLAAIESAAAAGDAEAFASRFTADSRPFAEALLRIQKDVRKDEPAKAPVENISRSRVLSESINGNKAVVKVAGPAGPGGVVFVRENGKWKLDVAATEQAADLFDGTAE